MPYPVAAARGGKATVTYAPGAFVGAYDAIANLVHVYEPARCTLSAYSGNALVRLRRASDDAESDFSHVSAANPELDTAAITAWLGGAAGYVVTIYDQKGGNNITQGTAANQPLYVVSVKNGHSGMSFNGSYWIRGAFGGALSQPFSVYALAQLDAGAVNSGMDYCLIDSDDTTNRLPIGTNSALNPDAWFVGAGLIINGSATNSNWNQWSVLINGASSQFWHNNVSQASGDTGTQNADGLTVGANRVAASKWLGNIAAITIADPSHSDAQRGDMQTAINSYWAVY